MSGYLLHVLERSLWIEEKYGRPLVTLLAAQRGTGIRPVRPKSTRATTLLRCSVDEATRIRVAAKRRQMSISEFVVFSLRRYWKTQRDLEPQHSPIPRGYATP